MHTVKNEDTVYAAIMLSMLLSTQAKTCLHKDFVKKNAVAPTHNKSYWHYVLMAT